MSGNRVSPVLDLNERLALRRARARTPVRDLARDLAAGNEHVAAAVTGYVLAHEPRLTDPDDPTVELLAARFVHSTVGAMLSGLAYGVPMDAARPTDAAIALFERLGERDDGLAIALRAQRLLADELWQTWAAFADEQVADRHDYATLVASSSRLLGTYTDSVCEYLTRAWPQTRRRRREGLGVPAEELVGRALHGSREAATRALRELGYPEDGFHVAVALPEGFTCEEIASLARRLELACAARVLADANTIWVRVTRAASAAEVAMARPLLDLQVPVGVGDAGSGLDGLRRTHRQAGDALRVALLCDRDEGVVRHCDVALLAVLCADETSARELARAELGPLAGDDELAQRLRETLGAYLETGESQIATAQRLFVHEKTVKYRLRQAEELLGRKISDRRSELAAALMVHRAFN